MAKPFPSLSDIIEPFRVYAVPGITDHERTILYSLYSRHLGETSPEADEKIMWASGSTTYHAFKRLVELGLVIKEQSEGPLGERRTKYRIDVDAVKSIVDKRSK